MSDILFGKHVDSRVAGVAYGVTRDAKAASNWRIKKNTAAICDAIGEGSQMAPGLRLDSNQAYHFARELEHIYSDILREQYAENDALRLFHVDSTPRPGAKTHTVRRIQHENETRYFRANASNQGSSGANRLEKQYPIHPIVTSIRFNLFEEMASGFANSALRTELEYAATRGMADFLNTKTWHGDEEQGVYGVLNSPWIAKTFTAVPFTDASTADAILGELHRMANNASIVSKNVYHSTRAIFSIRDFRYLSSRKRSATTDQTIMQAFVADSPSIQTVESTHEFDKSGPNGSNVLMFDRGNDRNSVANVIPQGFTMLPIQQTGFDFYIPCYMLHGGVVMREPLSNLIAYV